MKKTSDRLQGPSQVVVLVSNGPGELATWVKPLAEHLHECVSMRPRALSASTGLRLVLVPCPNSTGQEAEVASAWGCFEQIEKAELFWNLVRFPNRFGSWPKNGLVVFLGGDQFWSVLLSARLGYRHLTYAEWVARWPGWNDRIAAMSSKVRNSLKSSYRERCVVVLSLIHI